MIKANKTAMGAGCVIGILAVFTGELFAQSSPITLQWFEVKHATARRRLPDAFMAGYNRVWFPPPGRADTGNLSVGYDVFNLFDLGSDSSPTLYGTESDLRTLTWEMNRAGVETFVDAVLNHCGFRDSSTSGFVAAGDYPGLITTLGNDVDGDFHGAFEGGDWNMRVAGLIDIAQEKTHQFIRHPVTAGDPSNIPNETATAANRRFYPDRNLTPDSSGVYPFNPADPSAGDPVSERAAGYLARYLQYMIEVIGIDGFRVDAMKHIPYSFFSDFYDLALYNRSTAADGSKYTAHTWGEVFDGNWGVLTAYIRRDGFGNRDVLDFPLYFNLRDQLTCSSGGSWNFITTSSIDCSDGCNDGSRGVMFIQSADSGAPCNNNVAHAYILTRPGEPLIYHNALQFGTGRPFPNNGETYALGGDFADTDLVLKLNAAHHDYGRGAYIERWIDGNVLAFERSRNLLVGLTNRHGSLGAYDQRTVTTNFPQGMRLQELTGNAAVPGSNCFPVVTVAAGGQVTFRVPVNRDTSDLQKNRGYVLYGPAVPSGTLTFSNISSTIPADPPSTPDYAQRLTPIPIITADSFEVQLYTTQTDPMDPNTDDQAWFKIDGGYVDYNGNGMVDFTGSLGNGMEVFLTQNSPRYGGGSGTYRQTIDATQIQEGMHYVTAYGFRHRDAAEGGDALYKVFRNVFYLDRHPPTAVITQPTHTGANDITTPNVTVKVVTDGAADDVWVFLNQPAGANLQAMAGSVNRARRVDAYNWEINLTSIPQGFARIDILAKDGDGLERYGTSSIVGIHVNNGVGGAPGDMNQNGAVNNFDIFFFVQMALNGTQFDPKADLNGDGLVNASDILLFPALLP